MQLLGLLVAVGTDRHLIVAVAVLLSLFRLLMQFYAYLRLFRSATLKSLQKQLLRSNCETWHTSNCISWLLVAFLTYSLLLFQVKLLMRFLCDTGLSGGSWLYVTNTTNNTPTSLPLQATTVPFSSGAASTGSGAAGPSSAVAAAAGGRGGGGVVGLRVIPRVQQSSSCDIEVVCSWRCLHTLTPDATQLADTTWEPQVGGCVGVDGICGEGGGGVRERMVRVWG